MAPDSLLYVQYGCGTTAPESWTNFDASPTLRFQRLPLVGRLGNRLGPVFPTNVRYGDIIRGLPLSPRSCRAIYCSHVLEHLSRDDLQIALKNTWEYLVPGGVFRFVLPDLEQLVRGYVNSQSKQPAVEFLEASLLGYKSRPRGVGAKLREWLGNSRHLWMWDYRSLEVELREVGFQAIRRAEIGDNPDSRFRDVEEPGRWENCLGIEYLRPSN